MSPPAKKKTHHESDDLNRINQENPRAYHFCLASDLQRKTSVSHAGQFEEDRIRAS